MQSATELLAQLPKSLTAPPGFTSLLRSQIYLTLWLRRVPDDLIRWCLAHGVLPPPKLRRARLLAWIAREQLKSRGPNSLVKRRRSTAPLVVLPPALPVNCCN